MSLSEPAIDVHEALERIPALSLLSEDLRKLLEASFEAVEFSLGDEIVREGEDADAFYLLVDGSARVVKRVVGGRRGGAERPPQRRQLRRDGAARGLDARRDRPRQRARRGPAPRPGGLRGAARARIPRYGRCSRRSPTSARSGTSCACSRASRSSRTTRSRSSAPSSSASRSRPARRSSVRATRPGRCT